MKDNYKLYSYDSNGEVRIWEIYVDGNEFYTVTGLQNGKKVTSERTACVGKNIGKANETSPNQQALLEAESRYKKKKKTKYYDTIKEAKADADFFRVMLADKWENRKDKIEYPIIHQPKLDGIRCVITKNGAVSRGNTPINVIPHILESLNPFFKKFPNAILDGELYNHDLKDDFQKLISIVRKDKIEAENLEASKKYMQYWIYDIPTLMKGQPDEPYTTRVQLLEELFQEEYESPYLKIVDSVCVENEHEADNKHEEVLGLGFEGSIYRGINSFYENKRSKNLLKRKDFFDEEAKVIDIQEGKGNWAGYAKVFTLEMNGKQFNSGIRGSQEFLKHVIDNKKNYLNKSATLRYFRLTDDGIPYLPVIINLAREDYEK